MTGSSPDKDKHSFFNAWERTSKELMILLLTILLTVPSFLSFLWPYLSSFESTQIEISSEAECFFSEDGSRSSNDYRTTDTFSFALCDQAIDSLPHFDKVVKIKRFQTDLHGNSNGNGKSGTLDEHFQSLASTLNSLSYNLYIKEPWRRYRGWYLLSVLSDDDSTHNTLLSQTKRTHTQQVVEYCMMSVRTIDKMRQLYFEDPDYLRYKKNRREALRVMRTNLLKIAYLQDEKKVKTIAWILDVFAILLLIIYVFFTYLPMKEHLEDFEQNNGRLLCVKALILLAIGILLPISIIYAMTDAFCTVYAAFGMSLLFSIYLWMFRRYAFRKENNEYQNQTRKLKGYVGFLFRANRAYCFGFGLLSVFYFMGDYSVGDPFLRNGFSGLARLHVGAIFWASFSYVLFFFPPDFGSKIVQCIVRGLAFLLGVFLFVASFGFNFFPFGTFPRNIFYCMGWLFPDWPIWVEILGSRFCFSFGFITLLIFAVKKRCDAYEKISEYLFCQRDVLNLRLSFGRPYYLDENGVCHKGTH